MSHVHANRRARIGHLIEQCWAHGGFGRTLIVAPGGALARELRARALLAEHADWTDAVAHARVPNERFDTVVVLATTGVVEPDDLQAISTLAERWLVVALEFPATNDGDERQKVLDVVAGAGWSEYVFGPLAALQDGGFAMVWCERARSEAALSAGDARFCEWMAPFVRPNDQMAFLGDPGQRAAQFVWTQTEASRVGVMRRDGASLSTTWTRQRHDDRAARPRHDLIVLAEGDERSISRRLLKQLIPGGRLLLAANRATAERLVSRLGDIALLEECAPSPESDTTCFVSIMRTPMGAETTPYQETVFAVSAGTPPAVVDFARHYDNPWLVHSLIIGRFRIRDAAALRTLAERVLATARPESADRGGALCVLAYQALAGTVHPPLTLPRNIRAYLDQEPANPHVWRWQISLQFAAAKLDLAAAQFDRAERGFSTCARMDFMTFAPHLGTKCAEAAFVAGWLAWQRQDIDAAEREWTNGLAIHARTRAVPLEDTLIDPRCPSSFEAGDGLREITIIADQAFRCANGLRAVEHMRTRGAARPGVINRNFQNSFRDIEGYLSRSNGLVAELVNVIHGQGEGYAAERQDERARVEADMAGCRRAFDAEIAECRRGFEAEMAECRRGFETEMAERTGALEATIAERTSAFEAASAERSRAFEVTLDERHRMFEAELAERGQALEAALAERTRAFEAELADRRHILDMERAAFAVQRTDDRHGFERQMAERDAAQRRAAADRQRSFDDELAGRDRTTAAYALLAMSLRERITHLERESYQARIDATLNARRHLKTIPLQRMKRVLIFGTGRAGQFAAELLERTHEIVGFLDNSPQRQGGVLRGAPIFAPAAISDVPYDGVLIASVHAGDILRQLNDLNVPQERALLMHEALDRLIVFGAGAGGQQVLGSIPSQSMVLHFVDNAVDKQGTLVSGISVIAPTKLLSLSYRYIVVASLHRDAIVRQLRTLGVPRAKIVAVAPLAPVSFIAPRIDRSVPDDTKSFYPAFEADELRRVVSFGRHAPAAALLDFEPGTLAIGVALAAAGCRVKAFAAPAFIDQCGAKGIVPVVAPFTASNLGEHALLVTGRRGLPPALDGQLTSTHRLISMARDESAHLHTTHLSFWYAPPREWLAAECA